MMEPSVSPRVPSPWDIRADLVRRITADLLGPLEGENEVILGYQRHDGRWARPDRVRDRYLVGMLAPRGTVAVDPERDDDVGPEEGDDTGESVQDGRVPRLALAPSSMGLSLVVDSEVDRLVARCSWGQYLKEFHDQEDGSRAAVWVRYPRQHTVVVRLTPGEFDPIEVNGEGVVLRGRAIPSEMGPWLVSLFLSNEQEQLDRNKDSRWLFQAGLELEAANGSAVFLGRASVLGKDASGSQWEHFEMAHLDMLYRDTVEFAVGHGVGVEATVSTADPRRATRLATAVIPRYEVWRTDAPRPDAASHLAGLITDMKELSRLSPDELRMAMLPLAEGFRSWLDNEEERIGDPAARLEGYEEIAREVIGRAHKVAHGVAAGIDLVCTDPDALEAFRFANRTMWYQRVHTVAIEARRGDPGLSLRDAVLRADHSDNRSWRPFQLAFILLCIPSLTDLAHPERSKDKSLADLLFFPTGGGKTEAYLGLVAFTVATRRLQGVIGVGEDAVDGRDGVAVLMRYTLRLLTTQQFQRAATLMCAAELLRQNLAETDNRYEGEPFRLGMWVGASVSPNRSRDAQRFTEDARLGSTSAGQSTPLQLTDCPWCGREIQPDTDTSYDSVRARFLVYCGNAQECPVHPTTRRG